MSNINDNNLDDLLRRAAEKYPLRTDSADWGKLVSDLEKEPSLILPPVGEDRQRRRRFFWLFLLLPLAGVGYYAWHAAGRSVSLADQASVVAGKDGQAPANAGNAQPEQGGHVGEKGQANAQPEQGGHVGGMNGGKTRQADAAGQGDQASSAGRNGQANVTVQDGQKAVAAGKKGPAHAGGQNGQNNVTGQDGQASVSGQDGQVKIPGQDGHVPGQSGQMSGQRLSGQTGMRAGKTGQLSVTTKEKDGHERGEAVGRNSRLGGDNAPGDNATGENTEDGNVSRANVTTGQDPRGLHLASNNMQRVNTKMRGDVAAGNIPVKSSAKKDNIKLQKAKPSFYVGILGSPDLSTIKWQSVKNVGTRFGLLLGYSFNSRWSIESGAYYSRKNYYTDGEYFDKTNAYILKYVDQLKVNGVCNMWEFPVNVRYNLSTGQKMKWFATAGVSAYYMSKEKYDCSGYLNGAPWSEEWNKKPSHNSWSSNLNLSVGYEQRLGRIGNLRLEPYVRVPMTGIGTGKLSIMSAGLNIGITRRIW